MRSPRHGSAPRGRRRPLTVAATMTGAVLAVSAGVGLDRVVLPAFEDQPGTTVVAQRGTGVANGRDASVNAPAPGLKTASPGTTAAPSSPSSPALPKESAAPLKKLRQTAPPKKGGGSGTGGGDSQPDSGSGNEGSGGSGSGGSGGSGGTDTPPPPSGAAGLEGSVVQLTNEERAKAGCAPLRIDQRLVNSARAHSADMAAKGYFSHTSPNGESPFQRMEKAGYPDPGAENIAMGYPTPAAVMEGWMNSSGHRANILNCKLKAIGVGVQTGSGGPWWTQNFGWS